MNAPAMAMAVVRAMINGGADDRPMIAQKMSSSRLCCICTFHLDTAKWDFYASHTP